jgi:hypothetical protein
LLHLLLKKDAFRREHDRSICCYIHAHLGFYCCWETELPTPTRSECRAQFLAWDSLRCNWNGVRSARDAKFLSPQTHATKRLLYPDKRFRLGEISPNGESFKSFFDFSSSQISDFLKILFILN